MTYHMDNKVRKYIQAYGSLSFKKLGNKLLSRYNKYGKKIVNRVITAENFLKNSAKKNNESKYGKTLKKKVQKKAVGHYIGSKITDKLTSLSGRKEEEPYEKEPEEIIISPKTDSKLLMIYECFKNYGIKMKYKKIENLLG